jgi:hypothetical protein
MRIGDLLADTVVVPAAAAGPEQQEASAQHEPEPAAAPGVPPVPEG